MILIFGGAYQGKLDYAKEQFPIETVCDCSGGAAPDFAADAIYGIDGFVKHCACSESSVEAAEWFAERKAQWEHKILIMTDVSQGIVPMDPQLRAFREMNGKLMLSLAKEAEEVHRVFCGLGKRVK